MMILGVERLPLSNVHVLTAKFSAGSLLLRRLAPLATDHVLGALSSEIAFLASIGYL